MKRTQSNEICFFSMLFQNTTDGYRNILKAIYDYRFTVQHLLNGFQINIVNFSTDNLLLFSDKLKERTERTFLKYFNKISYFKFRYNTWR